MVGDLSLLAVASASPVVLPPSKVRAPALAPRTKIPVPAESHLVCRRSTGRALAAWFLIASRWLTSGVCFRVAVPVVSGLIASLWLTGLRCHGEQELHGVLPLQGKRPQDAGVQLSAPLQQHLPHHLEGMPYHQGQPMQMVVPGAHQGHALPAAYQAFAMPDTATLIDVQGSFIVIRTPHIVPIVLALSGCCLLLHITLLTSFTIECSECLSFSLGGNNFYNKVMWEVVSLLLAALFTDRNRRDNMHEPYPCPSQKDRKNIYSMLLNRLIVANCPGTDQDD